MRGQDTGSVLGQGFGFVLLNKAVSDQDIVPLRGMAALFDAQPDLLEMLPIAVYACDGKGLLRWFNGRAAELWGRAPRIGDDTELFLRLVQTL